MKSLIGTKTRENLLKAFAGESQARNKYSFFASTAKKEGYQAITAVFEETANHEKAHAKRLFKYLEDGGPLEITYTYPAGRIGTTAENLMEAMNGEHEEQVVMYPEFAKIAREEGFPEIAATFENILALQTAADFASLYNRGITIDFQYPNRFSLRGLGNTNYDLDRFVVVLLVEHKSINTISFLVVL